MTVFNFILLFLLKQLSSGNPIYDKYYRQVCHCIFPMGYSVCAYNSCIVWLYMALDGDGDNQKKKIKSSNERMGFL